MIIAAINVDRIKESFEHWYTYESSHKGLRKLRGSLL